VIVQRLFSTFANGLPGTGLLLQRLVAGSFLIHFATARLPSPGSFSELLPTLISILAGIFLIIGLWTPVTGAFIALLSLWAAYSRLICPEPSFLLGALGISLALIGPGAWSADARIFGRKHISVKR
jgi:putative oxidoreductase